MSIAEEPNQVRDVNEPIALVRDPAIQDGWEEISNPETSLSWSRMADRNPQAEELLRQYIYIEMAANDIELDEVSLAKLTLPEGILANLEEKNRLLAQLRAPIDNRIESFLAQHFTDCGLESLLKLPDQTFTLDRHGVARQLAIPANGDEFSNEYVKSYRCANGMLHNPAADRRTTAGTFHVAEGGLPIPGDKTAVPKHVFAKMFTAAVNPPDSLLTLPFNANTKVPAKTFVSLLLRPLVCPRVEGFCRRKNMEIRFFAPGALVSNLDFVESIFGNAGDPLLPENDAALDVAHWTGHTGCVILAPHLTQLKKKDLGLPQWDDATPGQQAQRMAWKDADELYNDGTAFKLTCRTSDGVIVTLIADNYYGYCKKEVKTQISYAANLLGNTEEEHAGGTIAFPSHNLGEEFQLDSRRYNGRSFADVAADYGGHFINLHDDGYGVDKQFSEIVYVDESTHFSLLTQQIRWVKKGFEKTLRLEPNKIYIAPSGYRLRMEKHPWAPSWRLIGTSGEGTVCHKPSTVSGGGKSEISKSLRDYMLAGPIFIADVDEDFDMVDKIFARDYTDRWNAKYKDQPDYSKQKSRKVLDPARSLGSVIKMFTPSDEYTKEYNEFLASIPSHIYAIVFIVKRFAKPNWKQSWRNYFSVDVVNGADGHELKYGNRSLVGLYLRVGLDTQGRWRTYKVRQDFAAADKIQLEDDITASVVAPGRYLPNLPNATDDKSYKFVANCEFRLFQRPDDAVHRGFDKQTEIDMSRPGSFFCNYEPLTQKDVAAEHAAVMTFDRYSDPMQEWLESFIDQSNSKYIVSNAHPRLVDGKPTKNPRYLQDRPDLINPLDRYVALRGMQLARSAPATAALHMPVDAILSGRRNNPPDKKAGIRSLAVYNPIHYQDLPELFMDYVCSLTGKSPSTTGAGSEGALTKGPFNALPPVHDLNATLVSMILTGLGGFSTAAGHIGPETEVGHDVSMLVPEIWCRLFPEEREPAALIKGGMLERMSDFEHDGRKILASRLGYRITYKFVQRFFGRVFDNPDKVFDSRILKPEEQDFESFVDGIEFITDAQARVGKGYFDDGSVVFAIPPLRAILEIMVHGHYNGKDQTSPEVRELFGREKMLASDWYRQRMKAKQQVDAKLWQRHVDYLSDYCNRTTHKAVIKRLELKKRLKEATERLAYCNSDTYEERIIGTLGVDPALYN